MIVLSEEYWIEDNLKQHYDLADEIIIVEGAVPQFIEMGLATEDGMSVDRTAEIIRNFPDPEGKIHFIQKGKVNNRNELRQECLKYIHMDWVLIVDADEFYKKSDFAKIRDGINEADRLGNSICWYDFNAFISWGIGIRDMAMERLFRYSKDLEYKDKDTGQSVYSQGKKLWSMSKYKIDLRCWHYNRVHKDFDKIKKKIEYYKRRDQIFKETDRALLDGKNLREFGYKVFPISEHPEIIQEKCSKERNH